MVNVATLPIVAEFDGRSIGRDEVLRYEMGRIGSAARKLGVTAPVAAAPGDRREALLNSKLELGPDEILRRLRRDATLAGVAAKAGALLTARRRPSVVDIYSPVGSAAHFADYYWQCVHDNDQAALLRAHPDHFIQRIGTDGRHEVLETTGGSPLAAHFFIRYGDESGLSTPADPEFPVQVVGVARAGNVIVGGVRHQLRDTGTGFHARLTVEFPLPSLPRMIAGHRWHLAAEFSNWIEDAASRA